MKTAQTSRNLLIMIIAAVIMTMIVFLPCEIQAADGSSVIVEEGNYDEAEADITIDDEDHTEVVNDFILGKGCSGKINVKYSKGTLQYESGDSAIATVDSKGNVRGISEGETIINVKSGEKTVAEIHVKIVKLTPFSSVTLSAKTYTYDGKKKRPSVRKVVLNGKTLTSKEYGIRYDEDVVNAGTKTVTVFGKNDMSKYYSKISYKINKANPTAKAVSKVYAAHYVKLLSNAKSATYKITKGKKCAKIKTRKGLKTIYGVKPGKITVMATAKSDKNHNSLKKKINLKVYASKKIKAGNVKISQQIYIGETVIPKVKIGGIVLKNGKNCSMIFKNNNNSGKANVKISFADYCIKYKNDVKVSFIILPQPVKAPEITAEKGGFFMSWNIPETAKTGAIAGYQVRYSKASSMKNAISYNLIGGMKYSAFKISNLKSGTKYYVQIRTYKKSGSKKYYSKWTKAKVVKTL